MRKIMGIVLASALLLFAISPGVFANERYKRELVLEYLDDDGALVRTYKVIDLETGHESFQDRVMVYGEEYADGKKTAYDLKMHLINRGDGYLLSIGENTTVSEEVLRQWQEEGYDPVYEFGGSGGPKPDPKPEPEPEPTPQIEPEPSVEPEPQPEPEPEPVIVAQPIKEHDETAEAETTPESAIEPAEPAEEDLEPLEPPHLTDEMAEQLQQDFEANLSWWQRLLRWLTSLWDALIAFVRSLTS